MKVTISLFIVVFFVSVHTNAQTAESVIGKYVEFIGGKEAWKKVKTITTSGEYDYGGIVFPFTAYSKAPDRYKFIVPLNGKYYAQAYDGTKGWKIDAFKNETSPRLLTGRAALGMANEADVALEDPFIDYSLKGHKAILEGEDTLQGHAVYKIKFIRKNGDMEICFFKEHTGEMVMKTAISKNTELGGAPLVVAYRDYRSVEGIRIPFKTVCESNGQLILTISISKATLNLPVDDKEFQP